MMMPRNRKNCRKPRVPNPVERVSPQEYLLNFADYLLHIDYIACVFSREFIQPIPKPYAKYVAYKIQKGAITLPLVD